MCHGRVDHASDRAAKGHLGRIADFRARAYASRTRPQQRVFHANADLCGRRRHVSLHGIPALVGGGDGRKALRTDKQQWKGDSMIDKVDVVVIGAGALGASTAFHLARAGRSVALVDQAAIASQTSPRAAGLSGQLRRSELMTRLASRAVAKIERFTEETGAPMVFFQPGSLKIARTPAHEEQVHEEVAVGKRLGLYLHLIPPD